VRKILVALVPIVWLSVSLFGQQNAVPGAAGDARLPAKLTGEFTPVVSPEMAKGPVPRMPDGHPDLSGPWVGGGSNDDIEHEGGLKPGEMPLLPWAKALRDARKEEDEPYLYCTPMSVPRMNPYPWRFVQSVTAQGPSTIYVVHENGDAGTVRQIFMDGRKHPDDPDPTWYGHSIGKWEGDTLVIDTVGFNDRFWFDFAGHPHTEKLHTIERYRRPDFNRLDYEVTIDDPGAYTKPFTLYGQHTYQMDTELIEYICNENNQDVEHIVGKDPRNKYSRKESETSK
jgi:hypothetical protein